MTEQEAIKELKCYRACSGTKYPEEIEVAIAALEKQIPKKPLKDYNDELDLHWCSCSVCLRGLCWEDRAHPTYCPNCGQHIDWSE